MEIKAHTFEITLSSGDKVTIAVWASSEDDAKKLLEDKYDSSRIKKVSATITIDLGTLD